MPKCHPLTNSRYRHPIKFICAADFFYAWLWCYAFEHIRSNQLNYAFNDWRKIVKYHNINVIHGIRNHWPFDGCRVRTPLQRSFGCTRPVRSYSERITVILQLNERQHELRRIGFPKRSKLNNYIYHRI